MTIPAVTVVVVAVMEQVVVAVMAVMRVLSLVAVAALVMEVLVVPVVALLAVVCALALLAVVCALALVNLVAPLIYHAQWIPIRRCTLAVCQLLKQTRVGQLMVVADVACLVEPSRAADQEVVAAIHGEDEESLPKDRRELLQVHIPAESMQLAEVPRQHVSKHMAALTPLLVVICIMALRSGMQVILCMVLALATGPDIAPKRFQVGPRKHIFDQQPPLLLLGLFRDRRAFPHTL